MNGEGQNIDANTAQDSSSGATFGDDGLASTVELAAELNYAADDAPEDGTPSEETLNAEDTTGEASEGQGKDDAASTLDAGKDEGDKPFHEHPRWQEMMETQQAQRDQINELKGMLQQQQATAGGQDGATEKDYFDISSLSEDEIRDKMEDDPIGWNANLARQIRAELSEELDAKLAGRQEKETREQTENRVMATYNKFGEENKGFWEAWDNGSLQKIMQDNPGFNAISAFMTTPAYRENIQREADERAVKNLKIKQNAASPSGTRTNGRRVRELSPELKNPKKHGGIAAVLTRRYIARQKGEL